jgi:CubicO group peptidase (beta-lactamase class C family)
MKINRRIKRAGIIITVLSVGIFIFILTQLSTYRPAFDGTELERYNASENTDFSSSKLDELTQYIKNNAETTGMVVLYDGKIIYEYGDIQEVSYIASCRKSVLSMLYGKYVEDGTIDLKQDIGSLGIDEKDGLLPIEKKATVKDIITSRSGVFHIPANGGYDERNILARGSVEPGEYFVYNNWDFNVAGAILEQKTGRSVYQEIENQLAKPLGFQDWNIKNQKRKVNERNSQYSAYHMYFSTRDMAKIGQLMLNEGAWNGQQLIPKEWIQKITSTVTPVDTISKRNGKNSTSSLQMSYGYMWWLIKRLEGKDYKGAYTATGFGGQFITVFPKQKIVVAHKTTLKLLTQWGLTQGGTSDDIYWKILDMIMNAKINGKKI